MAINNSNPISKAAFENYRLLDVVVEVFCQACHGHPFVPTGTEMFDMLDPRYKNSTDSMMGGWMFGAGQMVEARDEVGVQGIDGESK